MALLPILRYPDARLHKVARPVTHVDEAIRKLINDMAETMYAAPGVGLAATQVDAHVRIIVIDVSETRDDLKVFVNPRLVTASGVIEREGPIHVSNVMLVDPNSGEPTRVGVRIEENGRRVRVARKTGATLD